MNILCEQIIEPFIKSVQNPSLILANLQYYKFHLLHLHLFSRGAQSQHSLDTFVSPSYLRSDHQIEVCNSNRLGTDRAQGGLGRGMLHTRITKPTSWAVFTSWNYNKIIKYCGSNNLGEGDKFCFQKYLN